ncbi:MAG: 2-amino-4-hydroxy-6-hydroxymethyldihydropteridine diphosphokinase [Actinobacteria bacterium 13_1_20CM_2_65_11]|nr:MAG: 2-amino-4-hydroxy-6-hydroxymethyldihydropteridine diphosphokinase [Actinobacteria bacterium 13_1_40CM_2_65_8]OLE81170.1 MAG: 2-amino-4-hydroxy-6-hydroxymethyldihydropteridine diphosphokinase [Actinobacteria bacterium 13_1_20CM_2_65_11]
MSVAFLGLGSNLGSRARNLSAARRRLRQKGAHILRQSRVIETEPWGVTEQPRFLNQVLEVEWPGSPRQLLAAAKAVEREGGRKPARRWGPRAIDIDILLFGGVSVSDPDLQIPHPRIAERPFVVAGLSELGVKAEIRSVARS